MNFFIKVCYQYKCEIFIWCIAIKFKIPAFKRTRERKHVFGKFNETLKTFFKCDEFFSYKIFSQIYR